MGRKTIPQDLLFGEGGSFGRMRAMKKLSLKLVVEGFGKEAAQLQAYYTIQWNTFSGKPLELTVLAVVAEHSVLSLAVSWETFVNDYFVAAINRNPGPFKINLRER